MKSNSAQDNNVLTKRDEFVPINFHPMPKRFMVWDKGNQKFMYFIDDDGYERFMVDISELKCGCFLISPPPTLGLRECDLEALTFHLYHSLNHL